jgi:hypothetical protein
VVSTDWSLTIRVLARRSATVFYTDAAEPPSGIFTARFSPDSKYIAAGCNDGQIHVIESLLSSRNAFISSQPLRYGKLTEEDYVLFSNIKGLLNVSISRLMAGSLLLPRRTFRFVCGTYATDREEQCGTDSTSPSQFHSVQMGDMSRLEMGMVL